MAEQRPTGSGYGEVNVESFTEDFKKKWDRDLKDRDDFKGSLSQKVATLFNGITNALKRARNVSGTYTRATIHAIEDFLESDEKNIDHCIYWLLLYCSMEITQEDSEKSGEAEYVICDFIIKKNPYLSFENLWESKLSFKTPGVYNSVQDRCLFSQQGLKKRREEKDANFHFQDKSTGSKTTPFHHAAEHGKFKIIECMENSLKEIERAHHGPIYEVIRKKDTPSVLSRDPWKRYVRF